MNLTWILLGVAVLALLVWAWRAQRRKFADEYFAGVTPGLTPAGGQPEHRVPVPGGAEYNGEVAVAFNPPKGVRPGLAGTVVDGKPETRDDGCDQGRVMHRAGKTFPDGRAGVSGSIVGEGPSRFNPAGELLCVRDENIPSQARDRRMI